MDSCLLNVELPGYSLFDRGKIRDVFRVWDDILVVTTDRFYLFDRVFPGGIAGKGKVLTALTLWGFKIAAPLVGNYVISSRWEEFPPDLHPCQKILADRSLLTQRVEPIRVESIVRGYLYGQAWKIYKQGGLVGDHRLPSGMKLAEELPEPVFTPSLKKRSSLDEYIDWQDLVQFLGEERAVSIRETSLGLYRILREEWSRRGLIMADTKLEFGQDGKTLVLVNEISTPDCSRFWPIDRYQPGKVQESWDKEFLENHLRKKGLSPASSSVPIPERLRREMSEIYRRVAALV